MFKSFANIRAAVDYLLKFVNGSYNEVKEIILPCRYVFQALKSRWKVITEYEVQKQEMRGWMLNSIMRDAVCVSWSQSVVNLTQQGNQMLALEYFEAIKPDVAKETLD